MDDRHYGDLIRTYDLATLRQARQRLAVEQWPSRLELLDAEIDRRLDGIDPAPPPPTARLGLNSPLSTA